MLRSLHMKLMLIIVLLIVSLMTVVGAFLMSSVVNFYMDDFYSQMADAFAEEDFVRDLVTCTDDEEDHVAQLQQVLSAYMGVLGVDGRTRNYYILDGHTGQALAGSTDIPDGGITVTANITTALLGSEGYRSDVSTDYMDVAVPITRGDSSYIVYLYDSRETVQALNNELFLLILEALLFGLLISVFFSYLLSKTMVSPLKQLTDGVNRVANGDFSRRIEISAKDEIGVLTANFNHMARRLQDTIAQVEYERNKLNTVFLRMTDGVVAFSRDGAVIQCNPAAAVLLQRQVDETAGYDELFGHLATLDMILNLDAAGFLACQDEVGERSLELTFAPFSGEAQEGGVLVVIHDVTATRKSEEQRKEFVANVSHELRTPITNVRSYAETLAENPDLPPETRESFFGVILSESDRMTHIVQDLLTLSRFDSNKIPLLPSRFPFDEAVRDAYNAVRMDAAHHAHTLTLRLPDAPLPVISADRDRILQVIMNVLSNAIKYTPDGGAILLSAGARDGGVWLEVDDNGIGIPPEDRDRIFERFYRVDKARSRESGGTGLGLSIAKEIVVRHGGTLSIVDKTAPGLTVRLELPLEGLHDETA